MNRRRFGRLPAVVLAGSFVGLSATACSLSPNEVTYALRS